MMKGDGKLPISFLLPSEIHRKAENGSPAKKNIKNAIVRRTSEE